MQEELSRNPLRSGSTETDLSVLTRQVPRCGVYVMLQCEACGTHMVVAETKISEVGEVCRLCAQKPTEFSANVLRRVKNLHEITKGVELIVNREAIALEQEGISESDAVQIIVCIEEVNPNLDEDTALRRMRAIRAKYR